MVHLYYGDGKGKTSCAMGMVLRAVGRRLQVVVAQFLKGADSGERLVLAALPGAVLLPVPDRVPFSFAMTPEQRSEERKRCREMMEQCRTLAEQGECSLLVLDEVCDALRQELVTQEEVFSLLDACGSGIEVVLTGRDPGPALRDRADYITEMLKVRHPYDRGEPSRLGIEW